MSSAGSHLCCHVAPECAISAERNYGNGRWWCTWLLTWQKKRAVDRNSASGINLLQNDTEYTSFSAVIGRTLIQNQPLQVIICKRQIQQHSKRHPRIFSSRMSLLYSHKLWTRFSVFTAMYSSSLSCSFSEVNIIPHHQSIRNDTVLEWNQHHIQFQVEHNPLTMYIPPSFVGINTEPFFRCRPSIYLSGLVPFPAIYDLIIFLRQLYHSKIFIKNCSVWPQIICNNFGFTRDTPCSSSIISVLERTWYSQFTKSNNWNHT